ncbi:DUF2802 domain-containing protein [Alteromonas sp. ASW11-36]|uniref:DUF2802 domain-containing protein n=1 Tax=Alteromonas arenosi TaxID=3055817 RepID=A0ABT7SV93_9ALTE|nr:DUF2802 domain-containing protein [Alteromonas sp. ASW11-36]MDM7860101.1 DUF2802 domain-containing protein [Alteromonas sp. ASW11-36]
MQNSLVIGSIIGAVAIIVLCFFVWTSLRKQQRMLRDEVDYLRHQLGEKTDFLQHSLSNQQLAFKRANAKLEQALQDLEQQQQTIVQTQQAISGNVRELANSDPEVKMYQRAKQMIAAGAELPEVIEICGLPKAEVELLFSMHQTK